VNALNEIAPTIIKWPELDQQQELSQAFARSQQFPGVIGCIDGCHIPIIAPKDNSASYVNRKGFHSILLQVWEIMLNTKNLQFLSTIMM
jgi:hypothetical protein